MSATRKRLTRTFNEIVPGVLGRPCVDELPGRGARYRRTRSCSARQGAAPQRPVERRHGAARGDGARAGRRRTVYSGHDQGEKGGGRASLAAKSAVADPCGLESWPGMRMISCSKWGASCARAVWPQTRAKRIKHRAFATGDFRAACRFDETAGDKARWLRHLSDEEFWQQVGG